MGNHDTGETDTPLVDAARDATTAPPPEDAARDAAPTPTLDAGDDVVLDANPPSDGSNLDAEGLDASPPHDASNLDAPGTDTPSPDAQPGDVPGPDTPSPDAPTADVSALCPQGQSRCAETCIDPNTSRVHCGACGNACAEGTHCTAGACTPTIPPRPLAPRSLGDVTQRRPTLRWVMPVGFAEAEVQLCRDRACSRILETLQVAGTSARPSADLPARSVVFWRLRARSTTGTLTGYGPTWLFHVPAHSARTGIDTSFNPHFDVNGDGYDDVVVGAPGAAPGGRRDAGVARVYLGGASGIDALAQRVLEGPTAEEQFGSAVAGAGDVNGDGYADLVVASRGASPGGRRFAGAARVFLGGPSGIAATATQTWEGRAVDDRFGQSVAGVGDVNGDGFAEVVVGAHQASPGGRREAGTVSLFLGAADGVGTSPHATLEGLAAGDGFGQAVAGAGDVNGDGLNDLILGAYDAAPGGRRQAGAAYLHLGHATGVVATAQRVLEGAAASDVFGYSVASAGDVNGDGYTDIVVGAFYASPGGRSQAGMASVFLGSETGIGATAQRTFEGAAMGDQFGRSVSSAGDLNGDGYADVVVGAHQASPEGRSTAGTVSIFLGGADGLGASARQVLPGRATNDQLGVSVARAGDVDSDGYADLIVGAYGASPGGQIAAGAAFVFVGGVMGVSVMPQRELLGTIPSEHFGYSVACVMDTARDSTARSAPAEGPLSRAPEVPLHCSVSTRARPRPAVHRGRGVAAARPGAPPNGSHPA